MRTKFSKLFILPVAVLGLILALVLATSARGGIGDHFQRLLTRFRAPQGGNLEGLEPAEIDAFRSIESQLQAQITWSSNRTGNHEIFLWDTRTQSLQQLTDHPHVDYFANFSPDGSQLVYSRSKRPWVSFREHDGWQVYVMNTDGSAQRQVAQTGYMPKWTPDGQHIIFTRDNRVVQINVASGQERVVANGNIEPLNSPVHSPVLAPDGRHLALVLRQKTYSGPAILNLETNRLVKFYPSQACQTFWSDEQEQLLFIAKGGQGGTRVMAARSSGKSGMDGYQAEVLMDLPGAFSHEYFPRLDNTGSWLVWGAAAKGHEHDRADYEIFLWQVGRSWQETQRLTHYNGNDQWPDIYVWPSS